MWERRLGEKPSGGRAAGDEARALASPCVGRAQRLLQRAAWSEACRCRPRRAAAGEGAPWAQRAYL